MQEIAKCEREKNTIIDSSKYSTLYKIFRLNFEYLPLSSKKKLKVFSIKKVRENKITETLDEDSISSLIVKCKKRLIKAAVLSLRIENRDLYLSDPGAYTLPPKC